jgi:hypothetical protein
MTDPAPHTPFRPVDPDQFHGHPMSASVPAGLRLELSRAKLLDGKEAEFDEWMQMLNDRFDECLTTLPADRSDRGFGTRPQTARSPSGKRAQKSSEDVDRNGI